eukprot:CAMPEP_0116148394 /NCGR_PEP_ID=MMETSP0329-20121206/18336_1 /TAXON_ID=697910 /ORGANISM="Pseudo-nitzschia arenysensis, Strain B593" /LENGTH=538 /DNA_ID=CAMNT_0003644529 /DNA_START=84 /DNA_END=1701 /DNA_ORIENTATION=+
MATTTVTTLVASKTVPKKKSKKTTLALPPSISGSNKSTADDVFDSVAKLLEGRKNIVVLVGAGISTSVGIPDFRSKDKGLYNTLDAESLGLSCPEDLFCIEFFKSNPVPFYRFAKHLYYPNRKGDNGHSRKANPKKSAAKPARTSQRIKSRKRPLSPGEEQRPPNDSGRASPSDSHKLLALLEKRKMLLRVYTQNIDGLEASAGVSDSKIVYCHGSLRSMSCMICSKKNLQLDSNMLESIEEGSVPLCKIPTKKKKSGTIGDKIVSPTRVSKRAKRPRAAMKPSFADQDGNLYCGGVLKPGITFFGETLDNSVGRKIESDQSKADALIVIGTSLSVAPISKVIEYLPKNIPRILINRTIVHPKTATMDDGQADFRQNYVFDAYLLGFCDDVTRALGKQLKLGNAVEEKKEKAMANARSKAKNGIIEKEKPIALRYASETGAKLLNGDNDDDESWKESTVPNERVLLFPGALPPISKGQDGVPSETYQEVAHCDGCSKQIPLGKSIFKCAICFDYDLCQSCYPRVSKKHCDGKHSFRKE